MINDRAARALSSLEEASPSAPVELGPYHVTGLLGRGGMGQVFEAVHREHGVRVALKTLSHIEPERLVRFKNEFRSVAGLVHPNLVPLFELGCEGDLWFFTMERIDGDDFLTAVRGPTPGLEVSDTTRRDATWDTYRDESDVIRARVYGAPATARRPSVAASLPRVRDLTLQLVDGVRALHAAGFVHADLKPNNVLVDRKGRVVILDFGLVQPTATAASRALAVQPAAGTLGVRYDPDRPGARPVMGTPAWMAPEQALGEVSEASDWYAVGLMLYQALVGVSAFGGREAGPPPWYARVHVAPPPPHELDAEVPVDLSALSVALLRPHPSERPSAASIVEVLSMDGAVRGRASSGLVRADFVGRARERAALRDAYAKARAGGAVVVHVVGPSGMGKSALLERFAEECRDAGALVLAGRCYERETVPYKAFDGAVDDLAQELRGRLAREAGSGSPNASDAPPLVLPAFTAELARSFPVLATVPVIAARAAAEIDQAVPVTELRRRTVEAFIELSATLAKRAPVVIRVDDLQWADIDSVELLGQMLDAAVPGLLVAASYRSEGVSTSEPLARHLELVRGSGDRVARVDIDVGALSRPEAEALAAATLRALDLPAEGLVGRVAAESAGIPFFVEELAHYVARHAADGPSSMIGVTLETVLARRVRDLPEEARVLVEVLSVANSPIPIAVWFSVAGAPPDALRALWALRSSHFVRSTGAGGDDRIELHHDRMRESVLRYMSEEQVVGYHLRLGLALAPREGDEASPWLFDAVRHLAAAAPRLDEGQRIEAARLHLVAGRRARRAAAFPLAFDCFRAGIALLADPTWERSYELALGLHSGAAEAAYLTSAWAALDEHVNAVRSRGRTILDQLAAREVQIDALIARRHYDAALTAGLEALDALGAELPERPDDAQVGAAVVAAMDSLARVGPEGLLALPVASAPAVVAAMRVQARLSSAAYFARPALFPLIACRLVSTSVEHGLSGPTPYAVAVYAVVRNASGALAEGHAWGKVALDLLARVPDRTFDVRTRHVVHDLVCVFTVPLASTLADLRAVVDAGKGIGDVEYAAYAAHAYVHNAFYAGRPLASLASEAAALGAFMRGYGQVNALHVHAPFEHAIRCFLGATRDPAHLGGESFSEAAALRVAREAGSRSAELIVRLLMGLVRFHFGDRQEASVHFEAGRPFLDGVVSTWHVPAFHQYAALAIWSLPAASRARLEGRAEESLAALGAFAVEGPANFAHRVPLVLGARAAAIGDTEEASALFDVAARGAGDGGFANDEALARELCAEVLAAAGREAEAAREQRAARAAYERWGAAGKLARLSRFGGA